MIQKNQSEKLRLDKWLWASRFFKTRRLASEAISGGKVHLNNMRIKPAKKVKIGDKLSITKGETHFRITILGINKKRRPAKEAILLYQEEQQSINARENRAQIMKEKRLNNKNFSHANKKQKRQVRSLKKGSITL